MPKVLVLTGPSGVGKDAVVDALLSMDYPVVRPPTMTTRQARLGEVEGVHHFFVTDAEFNRAIENSDLLEYASVYGNYYGVPKQAVTEALATGHHVVLRVDVQGAESLLISLPDAIFACLEPDSLDNLRQRLAGRGTESAEAVESRAAFAEDEMARARKFCRVFVNRDGELETLAREIMLLLEE